MNNVTIRIYIVHFPSCNTNVESKAKNLNWGYEYGSQPGSRFHHLLIQSIRSNQCQNRIFFISNLHSLTANKRSLDAY